MLCNELLYMLYYDTFWADCDPTLTFCFFVILLEDSRYKCKQGLPNLTLLSNDKKNKEK